VIGRRASDWRIFGGYDSPAVLSADGLFLCSVCALKRRRGFFCGQGQLGSFISE